MGFCFEAGPGVFGGGEGVGVLGGVGVGDGDLGLSGGQGGVVEVLGGDVGEGDVPGVASCVVVLGCLDGGDAVFVDEEFYLAGCSGGEVWFLGVVDGFAVVEFVGVEVEVGDFSGEGEGAGDGAFEEVAVGGVGGDLAAVGLVAGVGVAVGGGFCCVGLVGGVEVGDGLVGWWVVDGESVVAGGVGVVVFFVAGVGVEGVVVVFPPGGSGVDEGCGGEEDEGPVDAD